MSVFHRSTDGFEQAEPNRREVLLAAGGLAAATAIAAGSNHTTGQRAVDSKSGDKKRPPQPHLTVKIEDTRLTTTFDALAYSWGASVDVSQGGGGSGASAGRAVVRDLTLSKFVDASSPRLFFTLMTGRHLQRVTITWVAAAGAPTVKITLGDVLLTSISEGGSADEPRLTEDLSLNFRTVDFAYDAVHNGFDIAANRPF